jgi:hypothetical protein
MIGILGISLLCALSCAISIKYMLYQCDIKSIEYTPLDNSVNLTNTNSEIEVPPKYEEINLSN